jgi:hypothetical protein
MNAKQAFSIWVSRTLILPVLAMNLYCALVFILSPQAYAPAFELSGLPGQVAIRSVGILFVMWNIPYVIALLDPLNNRTTMLASLMMQLTGVIGESWLYTTIPELTVARSSILRFVIFDSLGALFLVAAYLLISQRRQNAKLSASSE